MDKMSKADNLDTLSNAELRAKCMEYGLANIPVTDSSRNVILKRLRVTMFGGVASPAAAKKAIRRETIAAVTERASPARVTAASTEKSTERSATPTRVGGNRRTIASAVTEEKQVTTTAKKAEIPARRRSVNVESVATAKSKQAEPMIVLDSDDDDDVLASTVNAEKQQQQSNVRTRRSTSRQPSLTKSTVTTVNYNQNLAPLAEESASFVEQETLENVKTMQQQKLQQQQQKLQQQQQQLQLQQQQQLQLQQQLLAQKEQQQKREERVASFTTINKQSEPVATGAGTRTIIPRYSTQQPIQSSTVLETGTSRRYSAYQSQRTANTLYPNLGMADNFGRGATTRLSNLNEFSDDTESELPVRAELDSEEEKIETPFLSNFARNLKRIRADPLMNSDLNRRYARSRTAHEVKGRIAMHHYGYEHGQGGSWLQRLSILNRQYHLLRHLFLLIVLAIVIYIFILFWQ